LPQLIVQQKVVCHPGRFLHPGIRAVSEDWVVRYGNRYFQIDKDQHQKKNKAKFKKGTFLIWFDNQQRKSTT
jgi:hypothetical protein